MVRVLPAFSVCDRVPSYLVPDTVSKLWNPSCLGAGVLAVRSLLNTCWLIWVILVVTFSLLFDQRCPSTHAMVNGAMGSAAAFTRDALHGLLCGSRIDRRWHSASVVPREISRPLFD